MRLMLAAALLALSACSPPTAQDAATAPGQTTPPALESVTLPQSDGAGNRLEALEQIGEGGMYCVGAEAWCVLAGENTVAVAQNGGAQIALPASGERWPNIIVSQGSAIVGVIETETQA